MIFIRVRFLIETYLILLIIDQVFIKEKLLILNYFNTFKQEKIPILRIIFLIVYLSY